MSNSNIDLYIDYWQRRQVEQKLQQQQLLEEARQSLPKIIKILIDKFNVKKFS